MNRPFVLWHFGFWPAIIQQTVNSKQLKLTVEILYKHLTRVGFAAVWYAVFLLADCVLYHLKSCRVIILQLKSIFFRFFHWNSVNGNARGPGFESGFRHNEGNNISTYATGAACQQRTFTPPDTWSCPTLGLACVLMSRLISLELFLSPDFWIRNSPRYFSFAP